MPYYSGFMLHHQHDATRNATRTARTLMDARGYLRNSNATPTQLPPNSVPNHPNIIPNKKERLPQEPLSLNFSYSLF